MQALDHAHQRHAHSAFFGLFIGLQVAAPCFLVEPNQHLTRFVRTAGPDAIIAAIITGDRVLVSSHGEQAFAMALESKQIFQRAGVISILCRGLPVTNARHHYCDRTREALPLQSCTLQQ